MIRACQQLISAVRPKLQGGQFKEKNNSAILVRLDFTLKIRDLPTKAFLLEYPGVCFFFSASAHYFSVQLISTIFGKDDKLIMLYVTVQDTLFSIILYIVLFPLIHFSPEFELHFLQCLTLCTHICIYLHYSFSFAN